MRTIDALVPIANLPGEPVVITTMSAVGEWPVVRDRPGVFHYIPSSMGQGPSLGFGLALAAPDRRVIVINGDGCMLMNLGVLVTIGRRGPRNFALVVLDNGVYEVTGGQPHAGAAGVDYAGAARACGIARAHDFADAGEWEAEAESTLAAEGPVFVRLRLEARRGRSTPKAPRPMAEQIARLRAALGVN